MRRWNLQHHLNLGGHLARAGEDEPELGKVGGDKACLGDVDGGGLHRQAGGVDDCQLVWHREARSGLPSEVDMVNVSRNHLDGDFID